MTDCSRFQLHCIFKNNVLRRWTPSWMSQGFFPSPAVQESALVLLFSSLESEPEDLENEYW